MFNDYKKEYCFSGIVWRAKGLGGWYFVTVPIKISNNIIALFYESEEGWGKVSG